MASPMDQKETEKIKAWRSRDIKPSLLCSDRKNREEGWAARHSGMQLTGKTLINRKNTPAKGKKEKEEVQLMRLGRCFRQFVLFHMHIVPISWPDSPCCLCIGL